MLLVVFEHDFEEVRYEKSPVESIGLEESNGGKDRLQAFDS